MPIRFALPALLAATSGHSMAMAKPAAEPVDLIISNVTVIDPETRTIKPKQDIVVNHGRIISVAKSSTKKPAAKSTIDASGKFAIPGLMDMHAHTNLRPIHESTLALMFANGVTGARDMASDCHAENSIAMCIGEMRKAAADIEAGNLTGPHLLALSSMKIQAVGGPKDASDPRALFFPQNPEQTAEMLKVLLARKPDILKIGDVLDTASYKLLLDTARSNGIEVDGHIPMQLSIGEAAAMGQRTIEHARDLPVDCSTYGATFRAALAEPLKPGEGPKLSSFDRAKNAVATQDAKVCDAQIAALKKYGTYYVPTHLTRQLDYRANDADYRNDPRMAWIGPQQRKQWARDFDKYAQSTPEQVQAYGEFFRLGLQLTGKAYKAGVKIMVGTDTGDTMIFPGFSLHDEMGLLVQAGLSPMDVLRAATTVPAEYLHRQADFGGLSNGKYADIVLLDANPIADIGNSRSIAYVIQNGRTSDRSALDKILADMRVDEPAAGDKPKL